MQTGGLAGNSILRCLVCIRSEFRILNFACDWLRHAYLPTVPPQPAHKPPCKEEMHDDRERPIPGTVQYLMVKHLLYIYCTLLFDYYSRGELLRKLLGVCVIIAVRPMENFHSSKCRHTFRRFFMHFQFCSWIFINS